MIAGVVARFSGPRFPRVSVARRQFRPIRGNRAPLNLSAKVTELGGVRHRDGRLVGLAAQRSRDRARPAPNRCCGNRRRARPARIRRPAAVSQSVTAGGQDAAPRRATPTRCATDDNFHNRIYGRYRVIPSWLWNLEPSFSRCAPVAGRSHARADLGRPAIGCRFPIYRGAYISC